MTERTKAEDGAAEEHRMRRILRAAIAGKGSIARRWAEERARLEAEGSAIVLCPQDCHAKLHPYSEHAHTWWDMYRLAPLAEYESQLKRAMTRGQGVRVDIPGRLHAAGVGKAELERLRDKMDERPAFQIARKWWGQPRSMLPPDGYGNPARTGPMPFPWLLLLGDRGTGKTVASAWCLQQHFRAFDWNGHAGGGRMASPGLCVLASEFVTLDRFSAQGSARLDDMRRCGILAIDDLGAVSFHNAALDILFDVLDTRYRQQRRTVLTANLSAVDFEQRFDFRDKEKGEDETSGRLYRRAEERGFIAHLTRTKGGKMGGKLIIGGNELKGKP